MSIVSPAELPLKCIFSAALAAISIVGAVAERDVCLLSSIALEVIAGTGSHNAVSRGVSWMQLSSSIVTRRGSCACGMPTRGDSKGL